MAGGTGTGSTKADKSPDLEAWAKLRPELGTPGYWDNLTANCAQWADEVNICLFWKEFERQRRTWSNEFHRKNNGSLLARNELPQFRGKGHERIQTKIQQLTSGEDAGDPRTFWPEDGPPVPRLNDLVRTRVVCAFLDGVEFIASKLEDLAKETGVSVKRERQGRLEGYFAQHLTFDYKVFYRIARSEKEVTIQCEVQIATQLATGIWEESHEVYSAWRDREENQEHWQWNAHDRRFIARQLGHMIHLADGLLVQLRDASSGGRI